MSKPQGFKDGFAAAVVSITWGVARKWFSLVGGQAPLGKSWCFQGLYDLASDGRKAGVCSPDRASPGAKVWGKEPSWGRIWIGSPWRGGSVGVQPRGLASS